MEEVGEILKGWFCHWYAETTKLTSCQVPVNLKDRDAFHLTIEEYLHSLISLIDELVSDMRNLLDSYSYEH